MSVVSSSETVKTRGVISCSKIVPDHHRLTCSGHFADQLRALVAHANEQIVHGGQLLFGRLRAQFGRSGGPIVDHDLLFLDPVGKF